MSIRLVELVERWCDARTVAPADRPTPGFLEERFGGRPDPTRPPAPASALASWEDRHGFRLPAGLKAWLLLSNGFHLDAPFVHPIGAIGPMVPFARMPEVVIQPESWFELGNPNVETVCLDLAYRLPGADYPLFTSGDDLTGSRPRIIASGFDSWFLSLLRLGGREYWFDAGAPDLGDPWEEHRRYVPQPELNERLRRLVPDVGRMLAARDDERAIAARLGITCLEVEAITRFLQHDRVVTDLQ